MQWTGLQYSPLVECSQTFLRLSKTVKWISPDAFGGGPLERPLQYYVDSTLDIMHYFKTIHELIVGRFAAIILYDSETIDRFEKDLQFQKKFEQLLDELLLFGRMIS